CHTSDLLFFLTRRSSDLASLKMYAKRLWQLMIVRANLCLQMAVLFVWVLLCEVALLIFYISRNLGRYALGFLIKLKRSLLDRLRSEEHTSELQSRENLVC